MRIAFDEHIPPIMARVFETLGQGRRFKKIKIENARDYAPKSTDGDFVRKSDAPWLNRFATAGGKAVVTGDVRMLEKPHELAALRRGFVIILFERKWSHWDFHQKSALLLFHWELVLAKLKTAKVGTVWCIPNHFRDDAELRDVTPDTKEIRKTNPRKADHKVRVRRSPPAREGDVGGDGARRRKARMPAEKDLGQGALNLLGGGPRPAPSAVLSPTEEEPPDGGQKG